ncbi:hypothetical protein QBC34DRAFT_488405 [Podospora aff. communis PSN243]|uniref:Nephrocystin 3-like N-terminal domain-containing protein n=1 Tax=Podospora aff. communis PSN243 TaxID=3040156 RepID=A0AAV9G5D5_9PEZI|nr:hypothetical protein QBC34DRAFT_488405 [Podospora aff. communis PSN243]
MANSDWTSKVFRLRNLPDGLAKPAAVGSLLSHLLALPPDHIVVYSVTRAPSVYENPSTRVATLQMKSMPERLKPIADRREWELPITEPGEQIGTVLILDTHFRVLTAMHEPISSQHVVDCIAIPGLASHPFGSWQPHGPDKSFMWILDAAPKGFRTLIYGYDSELPGSESFQSIHDIASKPAVFLAHSLGGLVLMEAMVQIANSLDKGISGILNNIRGAVMCGVPTLGMDQAHLMSMVEGQPNERFILSLSQDGGNDYVQDLNERFEGLAFLKKARLVWTYETKKTPIAALQEDGKWRRERDGPKKVLVGRHSATSRRYSKPGLESRSSLMIPINEDHSNMVKFGKGHSDLALVVDAISEVYKFIPDQPQPAMDSGVARGPDANRESWSPPDLQVSDPGFSDDPLLLELGRTLSALDELHGEIYSSELDFRVKSIDDPFEDTFNWIFELETFSTWLQEGAGLFWIHGKPGSGKSTLMKLIFQSDETRNLLHRWLRNSHEIVAGFFFHHRGSAIQKSLEACSAGLKEQLSCHHAESARIQKDLATTVQTVSKIESELSQLSLSEEKEPLAPPSRERANVLQRQLRAITSNNKAKYQEEMAAVGARIESISARLKNLTTTFQPFGTGPEFSFLSEVGKAFRDCNDLALIPRLERLLRLLLGQNLVHIDLILFFDALDEFDGKDDTISRFMKSLLDVSAASKTRIKVCMSSRPTAVLKAHFDSCPGFAIQAHTKSDIQQYTVRSMPVLAGLVPAIIERANGIFLWVKLATRVLLETIQQAPESVTLRDLETKLEKLPEDLLEFYEMIVERISKQYRFRTFALLDLLFRQTDPPFTALQVRDAVMLSDCGTFEEAVERLAAATTSLTSDERGARDDIHTWSGGLVEIKLQNGISRPQFMHQTVLEFIMGPWFKRIVVGDHMTTILHESGHSFYTKYWLAHRAIEAREHTDLGLFAHHAVLSEGTTGKSQYRFLSTIRFRDLQVFDHGTRFHPASDRLNPMRDYLFLLLAASFGLNLCLRDWVERNGRLQLGSPEDRWPLLSSLFFFPPSGKFEARYLDTAQILFDNGFRITQDPHFFPRVLAELWASRLKGADEEDRTLPDPLMRSIPTGTLLTLVKLALDCGQDPNTTLTFFSSIGIPECRPLHVASPAVAEELIKRGADPKLASAQRSPRLAIHWIFEHPEEFKGEGRLDCAGRYEMCDILVRNGGIIDGMRLHAAERTLAEFESNGHDTTLIHRDGRSCREELRG